jgi:hypothetical protein
LDSVTDNLVDPVWLLDTWTIRGAEYKEKAVIIRNSDERLPRKVLYFADGNYHAVSTSGRPVNGPLPKPFDKGFTNAIYEVLEFTNASGVFIPTKFIFTRYGLRTQSNSTTLAIITETVAETTRIEAPGFNHDWKPALKGPHWIIDTRFQSPTGSVNHFAYPVTNGAWKSIEEAGKEYENQAKIMPSTLPVGAPAQKAPKERR